MPCEHNLLVTCCVFKTLRSSFKFEAMMTCLDSTYLPDSQKSKDISCLSSPLTSPRVGVRQIPVWSCLLNSLKLGMGWRIRKFKGGRVGGGGGSEG